VSARRSDETATPRAKKATCRVDTRPTKTPREIASSVPRPRHRAASYSITYGFLVSRKRTVRVGTEIQARDEKRAPRSDTKATMASVLRASVGVGVGVADARARTPRRVSRSASASASSRLPVASADDAPSAVPTETAVFGVG